MNRIVRRCAFAFALVSAAVALPSLAWYVAGSREKAREAERIVSDAQCASEDAARRTAASLASRLEALRRTESRRPFYHYQNLYHDPKGAYEGPSIIPSPLADGPQDPMIRAHFQIDAGGRIELPTINSRVPELNRGAVGADQRAVLDALAACGASCRLTGGPGRFVASEDPSGIEPAKLGPATGSDSRGGWRRFVMDEAAWIQNRGASELYLDLKGWEGTPDCTLKEQALAASRTARTVEIEVGPFQWRTLPVGERPALAALRAVRTPDGPITQGFVVDGGRIQDWVDRSGGDVRFVPAGSTQVLEAVLPIHGTEWAIAVDVDRRLDDARRAAAAGMTEFRAKFGLAVAAAWLVGLGVVGLVWQTERVAQQRSRFAASAAHELRTPLAALRMYGEMLAEGIGEPARRDEYARRIASESERLGRVVSNVMEYARLERGLLNVRSVPGDLAAAVLECIRGQRPALEAAGAVVRTDFPAGLPAVPFDRDALCHVLQNLLDNAEKYGREAPDRTILVTLETVPGRARVIVADRGPGVAPGERDGLFRPFTRGRRSDGPAGLGLGLVLSRALARSMNGDLTYEDRPGGGSRFVLSLPA